MVLRRMGYFVAVAEELHFGRAAKRLHIAQPGLSQQIKALEAELGVKLLERGPRGVYLTNAGSVFLEDAQDILNRGDEAVRRVQALAAGFTDTLRIAHTRSAPELGRELTERFRREFPWVEVVQDSAWTARNVELLRTGGADVAVVRLPLMDADDIETLFLSSFAVVVALPSSHPLSRKTILSRSDLIDQPMVEWPRAQGPGAYDALHQELWGAEPPLIAAVEPDVEHIFAAVAGGAGIAILDEHRATRLQVPGTLLRQLEEAPRSSYGLAFARDRRRDVVVDLIVSTGSQLASDGGRADRRMD